MAFLSESTKLGPNGNSRVESGSDSLMLSILHRRIGKLNATPQDSIGAAEYQRFASVMERASNSSLHAAPVVLATQQTILETTSHRTTTMPVIRPALPPTVELSLTIVYFVMFSLLFILVYAQLWMIWYYRHKRLSHQTLFLFMCLVWAGLRTTLFSFYFYDCDTVNGLSVTFYWLLYSFPVCLQFSMLCLLLHFFAQIVLKARAKYEPGQYKVPLRIFLSLSVIAFIALNLVFAWLTCADNLQSQYSTWKFVTIRVVLTEAMFFFYGCMLSFCIYRMAKTASSHRVLEAKGFTVCQAMVTCIITTLLFLSRAVYNFITICPCMKKAAPNFGYDWINVTDQMLSWCCGGNISILSAVIVTTPRLLSLCQADALVGDLSHGLAYVSFGIVLFLWEVLPITMVVFFFRVRRLHVGHVPTDFSQQQYDRRVFFFDNPRRYDSEDDLAHQSGPRSYPEIGVRNSVNGEIPRSWTSHGTPSTGVSWGVDATIPSSQAHPTSGSMRSGAGMSNPRMQGVSPKRTRYGSIDGESSKAPEWY